MAYRPCAVCARPVLSRRAFLFEEEAFMHTRCWPPLRQLLDEATAPPPKSPARPDGR